MSQQASRHRVETSPPQSTEGSQRLASESEVWEATKVLIGCYRTGEANDPDVFATGIAAVLSCFPLEVVRHVADPRTGLPGRSKWMPNPAEVRSACEDRMSEIARNKRYDTWGQSRDEQIALPAPREERKTLAELKAMSGPNWGLENKPLPNERMAAKAETATKPTMTMDELREHYRKFNLGFEPKPDAEAAA